LIVVIVSKNFQHALIHTFFLHYSTNHVRVNELINLLNWHIHTMIGRNVPFEFQKITPHIVNIDEGIFFMNIVLGNVDIKVVETVLI
jgi:hypothetical protein